MAASGADDGDRTTTYSYAPGADDPRPLSWTVYDADGRVVARGTGAPPDPPPDDGPPDEPHIVG